MVLSLTDLGHLDGLGVVDDHVAGEAGLRGVVSGRRLGGERAGPARRPPPGADATEDEQQERPVLPGGGGAVFAGRRFDAGILLPGLWRSYASGGPSLISELLQVRLEAAPIGE